MPLSLPSPGLARALRDGMLGRQRPGDQQRGLEQLGERR